MRVGASLAHYEILEKIGSGGMGEVYLARDSRLNRKVALKILGTGLRTDPALLARFQTEAQAVAALNHPNVVTIYSVEETRGTPYLTMEYIEGQPIGELMPAVGFDPETYLAIVRQLTAAVAAAHGADIVHRDLKPGNIMLTADNRVKVLDFGLAKIHASAALAASDDDPTMAVTRTGTILGTLPYMSPEQVQGCPTDARSDIFALGGILYELASGRRPFAGGSAAELASAILRDEPPGLAELRPEIPGNIHDAIDRCLKKDPRERFPEAGDLLAAILATPTKPPTSSPVGSSQPTTARTLAVLDFDNITGDTESNWLATGIAETVTVDCKKIPGIQVMARDRVVNAWKTQSANDNDAALAVGRDLGVDYLIHGAYQKLGESIRITGHMLDVAEKTVRGSIKLDGAVADIFQLQDRILTSLLESANFNLSASDIRKIERHETVALKSYELYAKARERILHMGVPAFQKAEEYLLAALELDPDYAQAHAAFGQLRAMRYIATTDPRDLAEALEHLYQAVALDAELGESYLWLTYTHARLDNFEEAIAAGRKGIYLDRSRAEAYYFTATAYWMRGAARYRPGDWEQVIHYLQRAVKLQPAYQPALMVSADALIRLGRHDEARSLLLQAIDLEATGKGEAAKFVGAETQLGFLDLRQDNISAAEQRFRASQQRLENSDHVYAAQFLSLNFLGLAHIAEARGNLANSLALYQEALARGERHPRALGMGRVLALTGFALAATTARSTEQATAESVLAKAEDFFDNRRRFDFSGIWLAANADILLERAEALEALGRTTEAAEVYETARQKGWIQKRNGY